MVIRTMGAKVAIASGCSSLCSIYLGTFSVSLGWSKTLFLPLELQKTCRCRVPTWMRPSVQLPSIVRENVWNTAKNVKSHVFWILKKKHKKRKNVEVITYRSIGQDHGDHPQSVLLSFTHLPRSYVGPILINNFNIGLMLRVSCQLAISK